eukprot:gnl/TRDRNA2_/TRDRNA2_126152_c0_seq2.p1 gnl/TRDRNA2_/TRDRNA2_126152_c0~~gnl/TRDRNA2_/TRDRNA2_126152_c0_seq2.p1  ORF type:complete len:397 (+),score=54.56 gnl/TRDRNA2_/TRDRNA2_126152_c0_seq2:58-1248(+)
MGNVDGVPVASQVKSVVQATHGDRQAAWDTQRRFSERCVGAAQVRSAVEVASGDADAAAETQRRFLLNARRLLVTSEVADAVPVISQMKSLGQTAAGEADEAWATQRNFMRRCPVVSQARSAVDLARGDTKEAVESQYEFLRFASTTLDKVPGLGHTKGWMHHALGDHERGQEALAAANRSTEHGRSLVSSALTDMFEPCNTNTDSNTQMRPQERVRGDRAASSSTQAVSVDTVPLRSMGDDPFMPRRRADGPHVISFTGLDGQHQRQTSRRSGLSTEEIRAHSLRFTITSNHCQLHQGCPICYEDFCIGEAATTMRCFHVFHTPCVERWLLQHGSCPVCRVPAVPSSDEQRAGIAASVGRGQRDETGGQCSASSAHDRRQDHEATRAPRESRFHI